MTQPKNNLTKFLLIMRFNHVMLALSVFALTAISCKDNKGNKESLKEKVQEVVEQTAPSDEVIYEADLTALNSDITEKETSGKARFVIKDGTMKVSIDVENAPEGIEHWQHFHGFQNGEAADCPTDEQDKNGDGIIDLIETETVSGTTMVPFNDLPAKMDVPTDTYPKADENGNYHYEVEIDLKDLENAFSEAFNGSDINLDSRVLYIHGVPESTKLPETVQSLGPIPAHVTLPIACGKIKKVD